MPSGRFGCKTAQRGLRCAMQRLMRELGLHSIILGTPATRSATGRFLVRSIMSIAKSIRRRPTDSGSTILPRSHPSRVCLCCSRNPGLAGQSHHPCQLRRQRPPIPSRQSDRGALQVSVRHTDGLAEAGITLSVGSVGDRHDNAVADSIDALRRAEVKHEAGLGATSRL